MCRQSTPADLRCAGPLIAWCGQLGQMHAQRHHAMILSHTICTKLKYTPFASGACVVQVCAEPSTMHCTSCLYRIAHAHDESSDLEPTGRWSSDVADWLCGELHLGDFSARGWRSQVWYGPDCKFVFALCRPRAYSYEAPTGAHGRRYSLMLPVPRCRKVRVANKPWVRRRCVDRPAGAGASLDV